MPESFEELLRCHVTNPIMQRLNEMSVTISQQQDANTTEIVHDLATIQTGVTGLQAQLAAAQGVAGSTITQAQEDALTAAKTTADALAAIFVPAPPPASTVTGSSG